MPAHFGLQGGPRQRVDRHQGHPNDVGAVQSAWVAVKADPGQLAGLLPTGFELAEPLLIVEASALSGLPWLAGRGYELAMVSVPVTFTEGGRRAAGRLELVTWENCPDAIVSGRDELGFNKVYADTITRTLSDTGDVINWSLSWGGTQFLQFEVSLSEGARPEPRWRSGPVFHYRVLARTGQWGDLELQQVTANTAMNTSMTAVSARSGTGTVRFSPASFEELPTLVHIVNALSEIRLGDTVDAGQMELTGWDDLEDMRIVAAWPAGPPVIHSLS